jgi:hypothetical protein
VEAGPGSIRTCCPLDSSSAEAMECGRPVQSRSSGVTLAIAINGNGGWRREQMGCFYRAAGYSGFKRSDSSTLCNGEYSSEMLLRRMGACLLTIALLLGATWPAVCNACTTTITTEQCGAKHGAAGESADRISANSDCQDCGAREGFAAKSTTHRRSERTGIVPLRTRVVCSETSPQNARFEGYQRPTASSLLVVRTLRLADRGGPGGSRDSCFDSRKVALESPAALLRSVRLKI